jgi:hypothetical protein
MKIERKDFNNIRELNEFINEKGIGQSKVINVETNELITFGSFGVTERGCTLYYWI